MRGRQPDELIRKPGHWRPSRRAICAFLAGGALSAGIARSGRAFPVRPPFAPAPGGSPMYRGGPARTGEQPGPGPTGAPLVRWRFAAGAPVDAAPAVSGGVVYVADREGVFYAVDAADGRERWRRPLGPANLPGASPAVAGTAVYVAAGGHLTAVDAATGAERWRFPLDTDEEQAAPAVVGGVVYAAGANTVHALDAATGTERWRFPTDGIFQSSPAVAAGVVYAASWYATALYALDAATGTERWRLEWDDTFEEISTPAVVAGVVYLGSDPGPIVALEAATGAERWRAEGGDRAWFGTPAVAAGSVYAVAHVSEGGSSSTSPSADALHAFDAATGAARWQAPIGEGPVYHPVEASAPAVADGVVYVGGLDGHLYAFDAATGAERWRFGTGGPVRSSPAVVGGLVYVGSEDGHLYALGGSG